MSEIEITIRSIQHFLYCPHRWGLLEIDQAWAENSFVTKANLLHEVVHDPNNHITSRGKKIFNSVKVYNDLPELNIYGVLDTLEAIPSPSGVSIASTNQTYELCIVEHKPTKPKSGDYNQDDLIQVFAQKICIDYIFNTDCRAEIFYHDVRRRYPLPLKEYYSEYMSMLRESLQIMRGYILSGYIPKIEKNKNCNGCSMKDLCMPKLSNKATTKEQIMLIKEFSE